MVVMETTAVRAGELVVITDAYGAEKPRRAMTGVVDGSDFPVVWVCTEDEWSLAQGEGRDPEGVPWPAEDVRPQ